MLLPIVAVTDPVALLGGIGTLATSILAGWAVLKSRKTEERSATHDDLEQVLESQRKLLDRYEDRIERQDERILNLESENQRQRNDHDKQREKMDEVLEKLEDAQIHQRVCEDRLRVAEAKIMELGG